MSFTGHHLLQLAAFLLLFCALADGRRSHTYHESWVSSNEKGLKPFARGTSSGNRQKYSMNSSHVLDEVVPTMIPIDHFRKPFDQFKWPWKNYEEWKQHQKRIEDKIDRMLKPRNRRFPSNPRPKKLGSPKKQGKIQFTKPDKMPSRKKHKKKRLSGNKKSFKLNHEAPLPIKFSTSTEKVTRLSIATPFPYEVFPTGGEVLAVKYYSTSE